MASKGQFFRHHDWVIYEYQRATRIPYQSN